MSLKSLIESGTKLWLDSVDPVEIDRNIEWGATGATSNPIIIADLIKAGAQDERMGMLIDEGLRDDEIAWQMTNHLVNDAQVKFLPVWQYTGGNNGYVSFELDPLLEDEENPIEHAERVKQYIELGKKWSAGHHNRMIKVPATPAGLDAMEALAAAGVTINVTLIFTERQYKIARDNIWRGAQMREKGLKGFKSVYSIFISRVDVYTEKHVPQLSPAAQGQVGIVNVKRLWKMNADFWKDKNLPLQQEIVFASTGVKKKTDPVDKYVEALAGDGIQTNPPATNAAIEKMGKTYTRQVDRMPPDAVLEEIDREVDIQKMEDVLMAEGIKKFADPQKELIKAIAAKRSELAKV